MSIAPPLPLRVGILEDAPDYSEYLIGLISAEADLHLVFAAPTLAICLAALPVHKPDVFLADMQLPDGSGLDAVAAAAQLGGIRTLVLTVLADRPTVMAALSAGAHGYLLKDTAPQQILRDIRAAAAGHAPISPQIATYLLSLVQTVPAASAAKPTRREREILDLIERGLSYADVAKTLKISVHTVGDHIKSIYAKLGVNSKSEAVFEARQQGWLKKYD